MKIISCKERKVTESTGERKNAVALGEFDGVHIGHIGLIKELKSRRDMNLLIYTFDEHPDNVLSGKTVTKRLTDNSQKTEIFAGLGIDYICFEDFSAVKDYTPEKFAEEILIKKLNCGFVTCGFNFRFGKNGSGDAEMLKKLLSKYDIECKVLPPIEYKNETVSSTRIRKLIERGFVEEAAVLLGRNYTLSLPVISGKKLGRTIGVPTVNQKITDNIVCPEKGVYACLCKISDKYYHAVCDIGNKPTVGGTEILAESHIIGYSGDLYGKTVEILFFKRLRDEKKFDSLETLKDAISADITNTEKYFVQNKM